jgi:ubiquitin carboxyl-terminal hydrolase 40
MRDSISRTYGHPMEVVYDTSHSVSPSGLLNYLSDLLGLPPERMQIAKHKFEVFEWIIFDTSSSNNVTEDKSKKGRKKKGGGGKGGAKNNIKNSPYSLKDGDLIGVKDIQYDIDGSDDFMTDNDIKGKLVLTAIQEDKRQRRKIKLNEDVTSGDGKKHRRPEVGIKIFVPDFTKNFLPSSSNEPHEA